MDNRFNCLMTYRIPGYIPLTTGRTLTPGNTGPAEFEVSRTSEIIPLKANQ